MYLKVFLYCTIVFALCRADGQKPIASFEDVNKAKDDKNTLIIDVREPNELKEFGQIPGSINIPLGKLQDVLKDLPENEFEKTYGRKKPSQDSPIIVSCRSGGRSQAAQDLAIDLGYKNVRNYQGGWVDWEQHTKDGSS